MWHHTKNSKKEARQPDIILKVHNEIKQLNSQITKETELHSESHIEEPSHKTKVAQTEVPLTTSHKKRGC
jgi:hypothetical protein